jgi:NADH-quinone oxidoreductase subunit N
VSEIRILWLPLAVAALAVAVLLLDVLSTPGDALAGRRVGWLAVAGLVATLVASFFVEARGTAAFGAYEAGPWSLFLQRVFLVAGVLGALGAIDHVAERTPRRQGEYWLLFVASLLGMTLVPAARDLLLLIVAFELVGMPLYVMAAYAKTDGASKQGSAPGGLAAEASLKLYLVGAASTAVTLFGTALVTGMAGTSHLDGLAPGVATPLGALGLMLVMGGVGYKIGMVPFHMWVPDTYQGASVPFVAFLSVAPKAAGMAFLAVLLLLGMGAYRALWMPPLALAALLSMAIGNLLALPQTDLRRLLGYSGIAQMGYVLLSLAAGDALGVGMTLFFLAAYVLTNLGVFLVVHAAGESAGSHGFESLYGLSRRAPRLAATLLAFLLSLAGIPFVVGFWAKLYVFLAAWRAGLMGLVAAAITLAVLGLFYYLRMLRAAYLVEEPPEGARPVTVGPALGLAIALCFAGVVGLGLWPGPLVMAASDAATSLLDHAAAGVAVAIR